MTDEKLSRRQLLQTAIAGLAEPHQRGTRFGQFQQMQTFGVACAPLLGGALLDAFGHQRQLWLVVGAAGLALVAVLVGYRVTASTVVEGS